MRICTILSLVNALAAATLLIVVAVTTQPAGMGVTPQMVDEASKDTSPELGLDLLARGIEQTQRRARMELGLDMLARGIEQTQRRATILKWLCYASLALLVVNTICWAALRAEPRPTNQPLERTGPAV